MPKKGYKHTNKTKKKLKLAIKKRIVRDGYIVSPESRKKAGLKILGCKNPSWKGGLNARIDKPGIHLWVIQEKGKAKNYICEFCKKNKALDWSNINHKYKKNLEDYKALCRSCHQKWDYQFNDRKHK